MEQKLQISSCLVCDRLLPLAAKYQWLQQLAQSGDQIRNDPLSYYPCQIPVLMGRRIQGCFHGWVILSSHPDNVKWLLWNPLTLQTIHLPPLVLKDGDSESISGDCCLPSPPDETGSLLLLTRAEQRTFVFCRLDCKRKRLRWTEMTYAKQLKSITNNENDFLKSLTCCNSKVYALNSRVRDLIVIQVDIVVKDEQVVITLLPFVNVPSYSMSWNSCFGTGAVLKGSTQLFYVDVGVASEAMTTVTDVAFFQLDMTSMVWEKPRDDLNDTIFFIDLAHPAGWLFCRPTFSSESGGCIHIFGKTDKVVSSYSFADNTVSLSSMPLWECSRAEDEEEEDDEIVDELVDINNSTKNSPLCNISSDVLNKIMELCVGVEYLNFRATCKHCRSAAPAIRWSNEASIRRLQTYSLPSPWLMLLDTRQGIITFTDPMFGDKYFMKTPQEMIGYVHIGYSRFGWLLLYNPSKRHITMMLFNPFTNDIREFQSWGVGNCGFFNTPPTSPDCMVVGMAVKGMGCFYQMAVNRGANWRVAFWDFGETVRRSIAFPALYGNDVYAVEAGGRLDIYRLMEIGGSCWEVVAEAPGGCPPEAQCFLVKCEEHRLLLVRVGEYGESVEVFKLTQDQWEKVDSLGSRMIYIGGATCLCLEAKTPEMENKIYFPRLHSKNGKMVFYSLETCRYHTFDGRRVEAESFGDFVGTKRILSPHAWIEPSWC